MRKLNEICSSSSILPCWVHGVFWICMAVSFGWGAYQELF